MAIMTRKFSRLAVIYRSLLTTVLAVLLGMSMAACGGGGGGGTSGTSTGTTTTAQFVQGTVAAPGGSLTANAKSANGASVTTSTETGVAGLTVTVGTIAAAGTSGTFTFTPITGATATSASDGTFTVNLPANTSITGNTVVVASTGTAPTTLPAAGVLVSPVISGKVLVDPVTTAATTYLCQQAAGSDVPLANLNSDQIQSYLGAAEGAASNVAIPSGSSLADMEKIIITQISGNAATGITLSGVIVSGEPNRQPQGPNGTLTSSSAFTTGTDNNGAGYNGTSTEFTAANVGEMSQGGFIDITGFEPGTSSTAGRSFQIVIPGSGALAVGTYSATINYSEASLPGTSSSTAKIIPTAQLGFGPGKQFFTGCAVMLWSASSVTVTVTAGTTSSSPLNIMVNTATYNPTAGPDGKTLATGTLTTGLAGTVGTM